MNSSKIDLSNTTMRAKLQKCAFDMSYRCMML